MIFIKFNEQFLNKPLQMKNELRLSSRRTHVEKMRTALQHLVADHVQRIYTPKTATRPHGGSEGHYIRHFQWRLFHVKQPTWPPLFSEFFEVSYAKLPHFATLRNIYFSSLALEA